MSKYKKSKAFFIKYITDSNDPEGEIDSLFEQIPNTEQSKILCEFEEQYKASGKEVPQWMSDEV